MTRSVVSKWILRKLVWNRHIVMLIIHRIQKLPFKHKNTFLGKIKNWTIHHQANNFLVNYLYCINFRIIASTLLVGQVRRLRRDRPVLQPLRVPVSRGPGVPQCGQGHVRPRNLYRSDRNEDTESTCNLLGKLSLLLKKGANNFTMWIKLNNNG